MLGNIKLIIFISFTTILLSGCNSGSDVDQRKIAAEIEKNFQMPEGSTNMEEYTRYYRKSSKNSITGVFIKHDDGLKDTIKQECNRIKDDPQLCLKNNYVGDAGETVWIGPDESFPSATDAGCEFIQFKYQIASHKFDYISCSESY